MDLAIHTQGLRREFGTFVAVDGIDLEVPRGSLYGFVGPNGAGKSTTIKCLDRASDADVRARSELLGLDPLKDPVAVKRQVGVVPEDLALFEQSDRRRDARLRRAGPRPCPATIERAQRRASGRSWISPRPPGQLVGRLLARHAEEDLAGRGAPPAPEAPLPRRAVRRDRRDRLAADQGPAASTTSGAAGTVFLTSHILEVVERAVRPHRRRSTRAAWSRRATDRLAARRHRAGENRSRRSSSASSGAGEAAASHLDWLARMIGLVRAFADYATV